MAIWQADCGYLANAKLASWVKDAGSTCAKLKAHDLQLKIKNVERVTSWSCAKQENCGWLRTSVLSVDGFPWMLAQAWVEDSVGNAQEIQSLQAERPLGLWLFASNSTWQRSAFSYTLPVNFQQLVAEYLLKPAVAVRKSNFNNQSGVGLILLEVFLQHNIWNE